MTGVALTRDGRGPHGAACLLLLALLLKSGVAGAAIEESVPKGTVTGCVEAAGQTVYRGVASLWPALAGKEPDPRRAIRPPLVSAPLGADGCFTLQARPGDYFVGAVARLTEGGWQGPPRPGDLVFLSPDAAGKNTTVTVRPGETTDIGRHASAWPYAGFSATTSALSISGRLTDPDGKPLAGLLVFAFTDREMSGEPLAVSEPSGADGRYLLRLPEPATVFLRAREHYGRRSPLEGGYMGVYGDASPQPVIISANSDAPPRDIEVFLIPAQRGSSRPAATVAPLPK